MIIGHPSVSEDTLNENEVSIVSDITKELEIRLKKEWGI